MARDPYSVLGLSEQATQGEINDAYQRRREELLEQRFMEGEAGQRACEELTELEYAYKEALERASVNYSIGDETALYSEVESLIKAGRLDEAQVKLNALPNYTAEWHYYQSVIYYRKHWHIDSKKQLELALTLDPGNQKYQDSLTELNKVLEGKRNADPKGNAQQNNYYQNQQNPKGRSYQGQNDPNAQRGAPMCTVCDCCNSLICADCCCECMGGDLISCC